MEAALAARNLPPVGGSAIGGFVIITFLVGIITVWLYAAIRPRFGPGPGTAVIAALVVWFFAYLHQSVAMVLMGILPASVTVLGTVWGLVGIARRVDRRGVGTRNDRNRQVGRSKSVSWSMTAESPCLPGYQVTNCVSTYLARSSTSSPRPPARRDR